MASSLASSRSSGSSDGSDNGFIVVSMNDVEESEDAGNMSLHRNQSSGLSASSRLSSASVTEGNEVPFPSPGRKFHEVDSSRSSGHIESDIFTLAHDIQYSQIDLSGQSITVSKQRKRADQVKVEGKNNINESKLS